MSEKGKECVEEHGQNISRCVEERVPDIKNSTQNPNSIDMASLAINEESCKWVLFNYLFLCLLF